jgi:hypothetical protein
LPRRYAPQGAQQLIHTSHSASRALYIFALLIATVFTLANECRLSFNPIHCHIPRFSIPCRVLSPPPLCPTHTGARARRPSQLGIFAHTRIGAATRFVLSLANAYKASIVKVERHSSLNDNDENSAVTRDWLRSHGADACVFFHFCAHLEFRDFQDSGVASSLVPSLAFVVEPQECQHFRASMAFYWH